MRSSGALDPNLGKVYGHCRLERKLGEGGMGMVYLATHTTLNKLVAVKLLRADLGKQPEAAERFLREARSAAKVEHPSVVQVHDIGHSDGTFYIVMQYVEGTTLEVLVEKRGALALPQAYRVISAVCEGVREAHHCGVIHRDIKPDNILLGKDGSVKLADFGLARLMEGDTNISYTGRVFGTPHFMSPEQALGEKVDHRSDIFSLGATFYRIVTGQYPFQASTLLAVVFKLTHETPQSVREVVPSLPQEVAELIHGMMARNPRDRISSMDEVLWRLREIEPVVPDDGTSQAAPVRRSTRFQIARRRARRRQFLTAGLAVAALVASAVLVLARYGMFSLEKIAEALGVPAAGQGDAAATGPDPKKAITPLDKLQPEPPVARPADPNQPLKRAVEDRTRRFLAEVEKNPDRIVAFVDPQGDHEKSALLLQRMFSFIFKARPKDSPPLTVGDVVVAENGYSASVVIRAKERVGILRWVKRKDEWYLSPPRRRWDQKK
jgi:predicted Ser/Thr protein kinase